MKKGIQFNSFADLGVAMGIKPRKVDEARRKTQQEKLCKCAKCGGQMERISGSNVLICQQEIEKKQQKKCLWQQADSFFRNRKICRIDFCLIIKGENFPL